MALVACAAGCDGERAPQWDPVPAQQALVGQPWRLLLPLDSGAGDTRLSVRAVRNVQTTLQVSHHEDDSEVLLRWRPAEEHLGRHVIYLRADNRHGHDEVAVIIDVALDASVAAPVFVQPVTSAVVVPADEACVSFAVVVDDRGSASVEVLEVERPTGSQLAGTPDGTHVFSWCPTEQQRSAAVVPLLFVADDGQSEPVEKAVSLVFDDG